MSATKISTTPNRLDMYPSQQKAILTQKQPEITNGLPYISMILTSIIPMYSNFQPMKEEEFSKS